MNNLRHRLRDERGFNLIELMIVIAIIGLLIGVGTLAWNAVIKAGNEAAAAQTVDNIRKFQAQYASRNRGNFGTFDQLVDGVGLAQEYKGENPIVNGYTYRMTVVPSSNNGPAKYEVWADPQSTGTTGTGTRHYYTSSSLSTIKGNDQESAKESDPSI
jgi:prepilin-type N-terminal cleavage/methylation domain-containing protein